MPCHSVAHNGPIKSRVDFSVTSTDWLLIVRRERNQQDATNLVFIIKLLSQHVSGIIMPIIRRTRLCTAACGVVHWLCWLWLCGTGSQACDPAWLLIDCCPAWSWRIFWYCPIPNLKDPHGFGDWICVLFQLGSWEIEPALMGPLEKASLHIQLHKLALSLMSRQE